MMAFERIYQSIISSEGFLIMVKYLIFLLCYSTFSFSEEGPVVFNPAITSVNALNSDKVAAGNCSTVINGTNACLKPTNPRNRVFAHRISYVEANLDIAEINKIYLIIHSYKKSLDQSLLEIDTLKNRIKELECRGNLPPLDCNQVK
jgi:hypothetical protein